MAVVLNSNIVTAPGTYVSENTAGLIPAGLANFRNCYMIGTGAAGPYNTPTQVISDIDLTNQFGVSPSLDATKLFFRNAPSGVMFFIRAGAPNKIDVLVGTAAAGSYSLTVNGTVVTYTAGSSDTQASIVTGLVNAINAQSLTPAAVATPGTSGLIQIAAANIGDALGVTSPTAPGGSSLTVKNYAITLTVGGTPATGTWSVVLNGTTISYTATGSPTLSSIASGLAAAIAVATLSNATVSVSASGATVTITATSSEPSLYAASPTAPSGGTLTVATSSTPPQVAQYIYAIENSIDSDYYDQGFMIAPEAFQSLTNQTQRTAVAVAMENQCSSEGFDWCAFVDAGAPSIITNVAQAQIEGQLYTSARGHLSYFYPYLMSIDGNQVPPSAAVVGIALRRYAAQGFNQPPAGGQYPVNGVVDVVTRVTKAQQAVANPLGINLVRYFPNQGVLVYGSRTRSSSPYYRFINTRVVLNVLIGTLRKAFNELIFSAVDGQGVLFTRLRETAEAICYDLWDGGALYGAKPEDAFAVVCNRQNNPAIDLEQGIVRMDVYAATVPTMERLFINVYRTAIGQVQAQVVGITGNN